MAKIVTESFHCDRCGGELLKECGLIIENMSFAASGYDPRGSGGHSVSNKEFCYSCSREFWEWFHNRSDAIPHKSTQKRRAG